MIGELFIRNDDVYKITPKFLEFHNLTSKLKIPVLHAVIPAKLTPEMKDFILQNNLQIAQHGYAHENYGNAKKYEFGPKRTEEQQRSDIEKGLAILKQLPNNLHNIFVPPFHGFDDNTLKILQNLNMTISVPNEINNNLKVHIPLETFNPVSFITFEEFSNKFIKAQTDTIGIYTHHEHVDGKELTKILKFLRALVLSRKIRLKQFGESYATLYT